MVEKFKTPASRMTLAAWVGCMSLAALGTGFHANNVFASRFDNTGDANQGKWIFGGQSRGTGEGTVPVPSLNIHTDQFAENQRDHREAEPYGARPAVARFCGLSRSVHR